MELDPEVKPVQHLPRKVPVALRGDLQDKLNELESQGVMAKVDTPTEWTSSMVAAKRGDKLRICLDPKDLNKALRRSPVPMPTIDDIAPKLTKAKVFSVMDAKNGFWQVALDESSSYLTTFWTPMGRYRWCRMPFGLKTASDEFQRRQAQALEGLPGVETIVDDVLIYASGDTLDQAENDHDNNLLRLLDRARQKRLVFNASKIRLKLPEVRYCGHIFSAQGIRADPEKVKAITNLSEPKDMKALQRFLGTVNYLARFLPRLSQLCEPLRRLLAKDVEWSLANSAASSL